MTQVFLKGKITKDLRFATGDMYAFDIETFKVYLSDTLAYRWKDDLKKDDTFQVAGHLAHHKITDETIIVVDELQLIERRKR